MQVLSLLQGKLQCNAVCCDVLQCVAVCCSANPLSTLQVRSLALNGFAIKKEGKKALTNERKKDRKKDRQKDNKERKNQCECRVLSTFISRSRAPFRRDVALFRISSALFRINFAFIYLLGCWHEAIEQLQCVCVCVCGRVCVRKRECVRVHSILTYCDTPLPPFTQPTGACVTGVASGCAVIIRVLKHAGFKLFRGSAEPSDPSPSNPPAS